MKNKIGFISILAILATVLLAGLSSCKKTESPLGVDAPYGLDRPTYTPTPQIGAIEVYVLDTNVAIKGVSIYLLEPSGNTFTSEITQPGVGYAAFNPPELTSGVWTADIPAQSISYVTAGPVTTKHTYGYSVLPITVTGGGQYAVSFTTGENTVQVSPISQGYQYGIPSNIPVTVSYYENGNLDVPVSVSLAMNPGVSGINFLTPASWVLGDENLVAYDTIGKNSCYYNPITLTLSANDFSGNPVSITNGVITKGFSSAVTLYIQKTHVSSAENLQVMIGSDNDCGQSLYPVAWNWSGTNETGAVLANGGVLTKVDGGINYTVTVTVTLPNGSQISSGSFQIANISWDTWQNYGAGSW